MPKIHNFPRVCKNFKNCSHFKSLIKCRWFSMMPVIERDIWEPKHTQTSLISKIKPVLTNADNINKYTYIYINVYFKIRTRFKLSNNCQNYMSIIVLFFNRKTWQVSQIKMNQRRLQWLAKNNAHTHTLETWPTGISLQLDCRHTWQLPQSKRMKGDGNELQINNTPTWNMTNLNQLDCSRTAANQTCVRICK